MCLWPFCEGLLTVIASPSCFANRVDHFLVAILDDCRLRPSMRLEQLNLLAGRANPQNERQAVKDILGGF